MKNVSTGFGLCVLGLGIAAWPVLDRLAPSANASAVTAAASAVAAASAAQTPPAPTIVWYSTNAVEQTVSGGDGYACAVVWRAWSDGRVEAMTTRRRIWRYVSGSGNFDTWCSPESFCTTGWTVISSPSQGLTFRSDINFDSQVDGADLASVLTDWGNAPRQDIPPSDCPLNLVNP